MLDWGSALMLSFKKSHKPVAYVPENVGPPDRYKVNYEIRQRFVEAGFPLYFSFPGAADAPKKVIYYNERCR